MVAVGMGGGVIPYPAPGALSIQYRVGGMPVAGWL